MSSLSVRHSRRFGIVPDHILEHKGLSLAARAVAAWLAGRQDGFSIRVEALREVFLGIKEKQWKSVRNELIGVGWWRSTRSATGVRGRFVWTHEFSDEGFWDAKEVVDSTIPSSGPNGEESTIPPSGMDGGGMHAQTTNALGRDNHKETNHQEFTNKNLTTTNSNCNQQGGGEIDAMVEAAYWQQCQIETPRNPSGWRARVRHRMINGITDDDRDAHKRWERFQKVQEQAQRVAQEAAQQAAARPALEGEDARNRASELLAMTKRKAA